MSDPNNRLSRKQFLQLTAAPALSAQLDAQSRQKSRPPNVLIIMTDQHRRNYMGAAGSSIVPTPNIDRIAASGVRFTNAICPYPVCAASRAALLTGLHSHTTGVINNTDLLNWKTPTVADHFARRGYHTGLIGKMHFNDAHTHGFQYFLGFNDWFMYLGPNVQCYADEIANHPLGDGFFKTVSDDGSGLPELPSVWGGKLPWAGHVKRIGLASELAPEDSFDAFVARESSRFLERCGKESFFLVASFLRPHPPFHPPADWAAKYPVEAMELEPVGDRSQYPKWIQRNIARYQGLGPERLKEHRAGYLGNLAYVDTCVGDLYKTLVRLGLEKDTIVVYTADHGEMDGDHGMYQKFCLFEPSIGVPLIVSQPGTIPENKVSDALVEYFGIYPTVAELTGARVPTGIEARSFAHLVRDPGARGPDTIFSEYNLRSNNDCYMIRNRRYKYIYNRDDVAEFYDLEADPRENANRAGDSSLARVRNQLHDQLIAWYDPATNPFRPRK